MIRVLRDRPGPGGAPIRPKGTWTVTSATATSQAIQDGPSHLVSDLYRRDPVKAALEELFHSKCAYCEQSGVGIFDWDVEHFRPKGRVAEDAAHPGYFWLAYTWDNLYPSCPTCNQRRTDKPTYADPTLGPSVGKVDQFPLEPGSPRAYTHKDDLATERPAILGPSVDEPIDHLELGPDGKLKPKAGSLKGPASIAVFGLNRKRSRKGRLDALTHIRRLADGMIAASIPPAEALDIALDAMAHPDVQYSFVARAVQRDRTAFGF